MIVKRIVFGLLILPLLACNFVTQMVFPPTVTPIPTATATQTATVMPSLTPTPTLQPAYIPPECATVPIATIPPDLAVQATPDIQIDEITQTEQLNILSE